MQIEIVSDLHLEFNRELKVFPALGSNVLVIAGDLHGGAQNVYRDLVRISKDYQHVVYVPGNHEYYGSKISTFNNELRLLLVDHPNIHFLYNQFVDIYGVRFIGTPLWTNFRYNPLAMMAAKSMISDFRLIRDFTPEHSATEFYTAYEFLKWAYSSTQGKKVIVTHFLPTPLCIHPKYANENLINNYFSSDLTEWIECLDNTTWVHGHGHDPMEVLVGSTKIHSNPLGYEYNTNYVPKVISI